MRESDSGSRARFGIYDAAQLRLLRFGLRDNGSSMVVALVCCLGATMYLPSYAVADWTFGGHAKYQYTYTDYRSDDLNAVLGDDPARDHSADVRLKAERAMGRWEAVVHYELLALHGDSVFVRRQATPFVLQPSDTGVSGLPNDQRRLFDLTDTLSDAPRHAAVHRLDRLFVGYNTGAYAARFGRQALSWGNGLVFHPLDFINPFSPIAIDKDYKTGEDMLYAQGIVEGGGDIQAIVVPRRDALTHRIESEESTYAVKWRQRWRAWDIDLLSARHVDDTLAGLGVVRGVGGAVWRFDALYTNVENGGGVWSFVTNVDYSWVCAGKNVYGFVEYFRNGFGESDRARYPAPNAALAARLARGELYTIARDYAVIGMQVEVHPLFQVFGTLIGNLNDGSVFAQLRGVYDARQDLQLMAGVNVPSGSRGDEYGGIPVLGGNAFLSSGRAVHARAAYYF